MIVTQDYIIRYSISDIEIKVLRVNQRLRDTKGNVKEVYQVYFNNKQTSYEKLETFDSGRDAIQKANRLYDFHLQLFLEDETTHRQYNSCETTSLMVDY